MTTWTTLSPVVLGRGYISKPPDAANQACFGGYSNPQGTLAYSKWDSSIDFTV